MTNLICFTQDIPGERNWINHQFPLYQNLETKSSGHWDKINSSSEQNFILEIPYCDPVDLDFVNRLSAKKIKTIYQRDINPQRLFYDQNWTNTEELLINDNIKFNSEDLQKQVDTYMMLTFSRCGTTFTESILREKYQRFLPHYGLDTHPWAMAKLCQDKNLLLCLLYRKDWWRWALSYMIGQEHGYHHYNSQIDWASLSCISLGQEQLDHLDTIVYGIFNFWCNLRVYCPQHHIKLFVFEDVIQHNQEKTKHTKISYDSTKLISNYEEAKELFESRYLGRWQAMEKNALAHLAKMKVEFTNII